MLTGWIASVHMRYRFFFNTIINRPFHWNHFCTSMSSVILHNDTISYIGWCGAKAGYNGNLYYFLWAGFIRSIMLLVNYLRHMFNVDVAGAIRNRSARLTAWSALLATSLVVMGASANFFDTTCGGGEQNGKCSRAVFGIVLGALSTLASVGIVGIKIATSKAPFLVEVAAASLLLILYIFGVSIITSQQGPGAPLGNLYYFTWGESFGNVRDSGRLL